MKRRILYTILVVDGALVLAVLSLHIADQLSGVPCTPSHMYAACSIYFKLLAPTTILLLTWGIGTLPVPLVIVGDWLGTALRQQKRSYPDNPDNPDNSHLDA